MGAFLIKARVYQALGIHKLAIINYSSVIKLKPDSVDAYFNRALLFEAMGDSTFANEDYRILRGLDPNNEAALYNLAQYNFQKKLWNDSLNAFTKLITINPENSDYHVYKARIYAHLARFKESFDCLSTAISINPDNSAAFFHRGCLLRTIDPSWAIRNLSTAILLEDSTILSEAYYQRGFIYSQMSEYDLALSDYHCATALDPGMTKAHLNMGILYMRHVNEMDKAMGCLNRALLSDPVCLKTYLCKGELYERQIADASKSLLHEGGKHTERVIWQKKTNQVTYFSQSAIKQYSKAIHLYPTKYLLYLHRGSLLLKQG